MGTATAEVLEATMAAAAGAELNNAETVEAAATGAPEECHLLAGAVAH